MSDEPKLTTDASIAVINANIAYIQRDISEIKTTAKNIEDNNLSRQEFIEFKSGDYATTKKLVYGAISIIITAAISIVIYFVTHK